MTIAKYLEDSERTLSTDKDGLVLDQDQMNLLHACMGLTTETGELVDIMKKHIFYGKPIDVVHMLEESGDMMWYFAIIMRLISKLASEEIDVYENGEYVFFKMLQANIDKLRVRYPDKFTEHNALNRDLDAEREVLSDGT
jgi:NTP pyrophosphatase (non-canonical NTP hydrolase)